MLIPNEIAKSQLSTLTARLNNGYIRVYAGTVPAEADTALSGQTLLGTLRFSATAFLAAADLDPGAYADANAITSDPDADADGSITFVRLYEDDNSTLVAQLTAGAVGADVEVAFETVAVEQGGTISLNSLRLTHGE